MYKINFIDRNNRRYDFYEFGLTEGENLPDKLEEVLYIMQELTPVQPHRWKADMTKDHEAIFQYGHGLEHILVSIDEDIITARDI